MDVSTIKTGEIAIIGTGLARDPLLAAHPALHGADVLIGTEDILADLAAVPAQKICVRTPVASLLEEAAVLVAAGRRLAVLVGGDPLFYSLGVSFVARFGAARCRIYPAVSSLQGAAAAWGLAWADMATVSLHGRHDFLPLAHAVMREAPVCLLTDRTNTPGAAARFLQDRGRTNLAVRVAARLGRDDAFLWQGSLDQAAQASFPDPCVAFFLPDRNLPPPLPLCPGQPEELFAHEKSLITKWPMRAAALAALRILPGHTVWDIGSGSGSVALEAAALASRGRVVAFERDAARALQIAENRRRFGAANVEIVHAALPGYLQGEEAGTLPLPDRVFVGGGLGEDPATARDLLESVWERLEPGGRMSAACALLETLSLAREVMARLAGKTESVQVQASAGAALGGGEHLRAMNPIFLVSCEKNA